MKNFVKKIVIVGFLIVQSFSILQIRTECVDGSCPFTEIDCAQCCKAGRFVSDECVRACNCSMYNDDAWAESKDFPH